ncbi:TPA: hypothetical protein ACH3X2_004216 [Trebouxia sp. C0005]
MAAVLREYIASFRIKELQLCLEQLGLSKRGRKLELQNRLLTYLGDSQLPQGSPRPSDVWKTNAAERVITHVWKQMHGVPEDTNANSQVLSSPVDPIKERIESGAEASSSKSAAAAAAAPLWGSAAVNITIQPQAFSIFEKPLGRNNTQISCICANNTDRGTMVQCEADACGIWQHCSCVGIDANAMPEHYFCQSCRIAMADPFWQAESIQLIPPGMLRNVPGRPVVIRSSGKDQVMAVDRAFDLSAAQLEPLRKNTQTEQLHVACLLLDDAVPNRIHWPRQAELRINAMVYRPYGRNSNTKLGGNARDEPANAAHRCTVGRNRISLNCVEDRPFCLMAYTVRRRTLHDVMKMMAPAESAAAAVSRVVNTMRGRKAGDPNDDDDDLLVSNTVISLKDPLSGTRIHTAARFVGLSGIVAFDLDSFLSMAQRSRKWQDPHTLRNVTIKQLQRDSWMQPVITCLKALPDVTEVEVNADGWWRPAGVNMPWQSTIVDTAPLSMPKIQIKPDPEQPPDDDSDEESEGEELRKAAKAYTAASKPLKPAQPEVIVLDDSSDDEQPPPKFQHPHSRAAGQLATTASAHANASSSQRPAPQSNALQASGRQGSTSAMASQHGANWASAGSSRQVPASFQAGAAPSNTSNGPLRIKLPTRQPDRRLQHQPAQQQQPSQPMAASSQGPSHPADPASSAGRLAAAVNMRAPAARHSSNALGKRKHCELDGQCGAYSQASAQAAGMSMTDHMHQAMHRSSSRLPPYPETSLSYPRRGGPSSSSVLMPAAAAHSQPYEQYPNPVTSEYWHQQHSMGSPSYGQSGMGSPTYRASMPTSPQYSPHADARYGRQASMQDREAAEDAAALERLRSPADYASAPPYWNSQPLTDGETKNCINCSTVLKFNQVSSS